jgi:hypothetical protein
MRVPMKEIECQTQGRVAGRSRLREPMIVKRRRLARSPLRARILRSAGPLGHISLKCLDPAVRLIMAVDSAGDTIDFLLSPERGALGAKLFLRLALRSGAQIGPRVINVDGHQAYAHAITELKRDGELGRRCRYRRCPYLNNVVEQDHRFIKNASLRVLGFDRLRAR